MWILLVSPLLSRGIASDPLRGVRMTAVLGTCKMASLSTALYQIICPKWLGAVELKGSWTPPSWWVEVSKRQYASPGWQVIPWNSVSEHGLPQSPDNHSTPCLGGCHSRPLVCWAQALLSEKTSLSTLCPGSVPKTSGISSPTDPAAKSAPDWEAQPTRCPLHSPEEAGLVVGIAGAGGLAAAGARIWWKGAHCHSKRQACFRDVRSVHGAGKC